MNTIDHIAAIERNADKEALKAAPHHLIALSTTAKYSFDREELEDIQLSALKKRFADLLPKVSMLRRFAEEQDLYEIRSIEDGALLLLPHTMYKSYPLSAIENSRFDAMTRWVGTLTSVDISHVDTSNCTTLDEWIAALDAQTDLLLRHSSGTTGKLSFVPASRAEAPYSTIGFMRAHEGFGDEPDAHIPGLFDMPMVWFSHRKGAMAAGRSIDAHVRYLYDGDESKVVCSNPGRISADMLSLGGRLEGAQAKGELGRTRLSGALIARRDQFLREQADAPKHLEAFFETVATEFRGKRVLVSGVVPLTAETAIEGIRRGYENLFSPDSILFQAGGSKGRALPDDYREQVTRFTGIAYPRPAYGMSESASLVTRMCPEGHYHIPPNIIPYLLDPDTGAVFPRTGVRTGRFGIIDIGAQTRWGGFLTGDEVTLNWGEATCKCGRKGPSIVGEIRRYSELKGGDDKITCAGANGVHDKALDFLSKVAE